MERLRPLESEDVEAVVELIESHDEDDAEEAEASFKRVGGREGYFVLEHDGEVIGITGYQDPPGCDKTFWLSWTYIHADHTNQGHGSDMIKAMLDHIRELGGRKIFIKVSDYVDPEDGDIYAAARHLYQKLGFEIEIKHPDYYDEGESEFIFAKRLLGLQENEPEMEYVPVNFNEIFEISETDDAYSFGWNDEADDIFTVEDLKLGIDMVKKDGGRKIFLSFPSNFEGLADQLLAGGFERSGQLKDYFEDGIHEDHFTYTF